MTRSRSNRMISGVCAGLAQQLGIPTFLMRTFFVLAAAIVPGVSLVMMLALYALLALILPWDDEYTGYRHR